GRESVPQLMSELASTDPKIRQSALLGLGRIGASAVDALEPVRGALVDPDVRVRADAIRAYWRISGDSNAAAPTIAGMLTDPDANVRATAAAELLEMGFPAITSVLKLLESDVPAARHQAILILQRLRNWEAEAEIDSAVRGCLHDSDPVV